MSNAQQHQGQGGRHKINAQQAVELAHEGMVVSNVPIGGVQRDCGVPILDHAVERRSVNHDNFFWVLLG